MHPEQTGSPVWVLVLYGPLGGPWMLVASCPGRMLDTRDSRVASFIPSMTMVGSMYGGRSPISDGVIVSPKAAFTVHDAGRRIFSLFLRPVPEVEAPLSMITLFSFEAIPRTRCAGPTAYRRFSLALGPLRSFCSIRRGGVGAVRSITNGLPERG